MAFQVPGGRGRLTFRRGIGFLLCGGGFLGGRFFDGPLGQVEAVGQDHLALLEGCLVDADQGESRLITPSRELELVFPDGDRPRFCFPIGVGDFHGERLRCRIDSFDGVGHAEGIPQHVHDDLSLLRNLERHFGKHLHAQCIDLPLRRQAHFLHHGLGIGSPVTDDMAFQVPGGRGLRRARIRRFAAAVGVFTLVVTADGHQGDAQCREG